MGELQIKGKGGTLLVEATNVSWGMIFPPDPEGIVRHPSQLYEAALEGIALFIFLNLISKDQKSYELHSAYFLTGFVKFNKIAS